MKDRELSKLKEGNKLLAMQFREKKEFQKKRQQVFSQVVIGCYVYTHNNITNTFIYLIIGTIKKTGIAWKWSIWKCE